MKFILTVQDIIGLGILALCLLSFIIFMLWYGIGILIEKIQTKYKNWRNK